jgi:hypothetical protein
MVPPVWLDAGVLSLTCGTATPLSLSFGYISGRLAEAFLLFTCLLQPEVSHRRLLTAG